MATITYEEFERVDLRSGTIVKVEEFARARKPAYIHMCPTDKNCSKIN